MAPKRKTLEFPILRWSPMVIYGGTTALLEIGTFAPILPIFSRFRLGSQQKSVKVQYKHSISSLLTSSNSLH